MDSNGLPVKFLVLDLVKPGSRDVWMQAVISESLPAWEGWCLTAVFVHPGGWRKTEWHREEVTLDVLDRRYGLHERQVTSEAVVVVRSECVHRLPWYGDCCHHLVDAVMEATALASEGVAR